AGSLRLELAQFRELEAFAKFGSDLDKATRQQITRGERLREVLKQDQYQPMPVEEQVAVIFAAVKGFIDEMPLDRVCQFEKEYLEYLRVNARKQLDAIAKTGELDDKTSEALAEQTTAFLKTFGI
ncbi:MAG: F0F1 ATP synthase subunit alpha, partial [Candidatus Neomarinimicrobiota bacterium]